VLDWPYLAAAAVVAVDAVGRWEEEEVAVVCLRQEGY
jgi:hypothetical protein